jgi:hypothetical protein
MEPLLPAESDWCNFRKRGSSGACKTSDRIGEKRCGFGRRPSRERSLASCLAHTGSPTLGASKDRRCWSKVPAGMARSVYRQGFEGRVRDHRRSGGRYPRFRGPPEASIELPATFLESGRGYQPPGCLSSREATAGHVDAAVAIECARRSVDEDMQCIGEGRHHVPAGIRPRSRAARETQGLVCASSRSEF